MSTPIKFSNHPLATQWQLLPPPSPRNQNGLIRSGAPGSKLGKPRTGTFKETGGRSEGNGKGEVWKGLNQEEKSTERSWGKQEKKEGENIPLHWNASYLPPY